jgi:hypothetical protein
VDDELVGPLAQMGTSKNFRVSGKAAEPENEEADLPIEVDDKPFEGTTLVLPEDISSQRDDSNNDEDDVRDRMMANAEMYEKNYFPPEVTVDALAEQLLNYVLQPVIRDQEAAAKVRVFCIPPQPGHSHSCYQDRDERLRCQRCTDLFPHRTRKTFPTYSRLIYHQYVHTRSPQRKPNTCRNVNHCLWFDLELLMTSPGDIWKCPSSSCSFVWVLRLFLPSQRCLSLVRSDQLAVVKRHCLSSACPDQDDFAAIYQDYRKRHTYRHGKTALTWKQLSKHRDLYRNNPELLRSHALDYYTELLAGINVSSVYPRSGTCI